MSIVDDTPPTQEKPSCDALIGKIVSGRYEILEAIGEGGSGVVFKARHVTLRKMFAVKVLSKEAASDTEILRRLAIEAQTCAMLHHPGLVPVVDFGAEDDGISFIAMDFVEGENLENLLRNEKCLNPFRVLRLARQATEALSFAHKSGVVHRDIKPSNIIVCPGESLEETVRIVDFGIAQAGLPIGEMQRLTHSGQVFGSPSYMSPEQVRGEKVDCRTDIYALGCVLYELLSGKKAFRGDNMMATLALHLDSQPKPLHIVSPELTKWRDLESIVMRCLAKDKDTRYPSMQELDDGLEACQARRGVGKYGRRRTARRVLTIFLCAAVVLVSFYLGQLTKRGTAGNGESRDPIRTVGYDDVYTPEIAALAILKQNRSERLTLLLAQAEALSRSGRTSSAYQMYTTAFYDAQENNAPEDVQIALAMFAAKSARIVKDLPSSTKIMNRVKQQLVILVNDETRRGFENVIAAEAVYEYASLVVELADDKLLPDAKNKLKEAIATMGTAAHLVSRLDDEDSKALIRRIQDKIARTNGKLKELGPQ